MRQQDNARENNEALVVLTSPVHPRAPDPRSSSSNIFSPHRNVLPRHETFLQTRVQLPSSSSSFTPTHTRLVHNQDSTDQDQGGFSSPIALHSSPPVSSFLVTTQRHGENPPLVSSPPFVAAMLCSSPLRDSSPTSQLIASQNSHASLSDKTHQLGPSSETSEIQPNESLISNKFNNNRSTEQAVLILSDCTKSPPSHVDYSSDVREITPEVNDEAPSKEKYRSPSIFTPEIHSITLSEDILEIRSKVASPSGHNRISSPLFVLTEPNTPLFGKSKSVQGQDATPSQSSRRFASSPAYQQTQELQGKHHGHTSGSSPDQRDGTPPILASRFKPLPTSSPIFGSSPEQVRDISSARPYFKKSGRSVSTTEILESDTVFGNKHFDDVFGFENESRDRIPLIAANQPPPRKLQKIAHNNLGKTEQQEKDFEEDLDEILKEHEALGRHSSALPAPAAKWDARKKLRATSDHIAREKSQADQLKALNEANRRRSLNREEGLSDLCVALEHDFRQTKVGDMLQKVLATYNVSIEISDSNESEEDTTQPRPEPSANKPAATISVKQSVATRYDPVQCMFVPVEKVYVETLKTRFRIVDMSELSKVGEGRIVRGHQDAFIKYVMGSLDTALSHTRTICIIQGLTQLIRKSASIRHNQVATRVRELMGHQAPTKAVSRRKKRSEESSGSGDASEFDEAGSGCVDPKMLDKAFLELQLKHDYMLVYTSDDEETVDWMLSLLQDLGISWYKNRETAVSDLGADDTTFLAALIEADPTKADIGKIKTSTDPHEISSRALEQIKSVSEKIANGITGSCDNLANLAHNLDLDGRSYLENLTINRSMDSQGQSMGRPIGKAMAKILEMIFTSKDPDQLV